MQQENLKTSKRAKPFFLIIKTAQGYCCKSGKKLSHFHTITGIVENKFTHNPTLPTTTNKKKLKKIENLFDKAKNMIYNANVLKK